MPARLYIDGEPSLESWPYERACQYGDGLFETVAVVDGSACLWPSHLQRLNEGCDRLGLPRPDPLELTDHVRTVALGYDRAALKVSWSAGATARGYRRLPDALPTLTLSIDQWTPPGSRFWQVRICHHRLSENPRLAGIKHMNRLDQVLGRAEWDDPGIDEGLMCAQDGRLVGGTMTNLYLQRGDQLLTPTIDSAGIAGVVRQLVLMLGRELGSVVDTTELYLADVEGADALYLSNALIGIVRVARCGDHGFDMNIPEHDLVPIVRERCHQADRHG